MATTTITITKGDTRTPLGATLKQKNSAGTLAVVDLTGLVVKFKMVDKAGTTKVVLTSSNVSVVTAESGAVQYDWQSDDVDTAGEYYAWFVVVNGSETDHFPSDGRTFRIRIVDKEADS